MQENLKKLKKLAQAAYPGTRIEPLFNKTWDECVTTHNGIVYLWFNVGDATHMVKLPNEKEAKILCSSCKWNGNTKACRLPEDVEGLITQCGKYTPIKK